MARTADVLICGAGFAGVSLAYDLAVRRGVRNVMLVDERKPLTLTSNKGTEGYRNWFPGPGDAMVGLVSRSIDLLEQLADTSGDAFDFNRRGYVMITADPGRTAAILEAASQISALGAGPVRRHPGPAGYVPSPRDGYAGVESGADLIEDPERIRTLFPCVAPDAAVMLHVRRAGYMDARRLGAWLLDRIREGGVTVLQDRVEGFRVAGGRVTTAVLASGERIDTGRVALAAGPHLKQVARMLGLDLPVFCELHAKLAFEDSEGVVPRDLPMTLWDDPIEIPWTAEERARLEREPDARALLEPLPRGIHVRPRGPGRELLLIWTYDAKPSPPTWPLRYAPHYAEVLMRGAARMIPGLRAYVGRADTGVVDGGYYCKTSENRPLLGPLPVEGAFVIGALSGFGVMTSQASAELVGAHMTGEALPPYADAFRLTRYEDPAYMREIESYSGWSGQL